MLESISAAVFLSFTSSFSLLLASFRRVRLRHVSSIDSFKMPLACKNRGKQDRGCCPRYDSSIQLLSSSQWTVFINIIPTSSIGAGEMRVLNTYWRLFLLASFSGLHRLQYLMASSMQIRRRKTSLHMMTSDRQRVDKG